MTHELILTSVAQGLDPMDHGFCPVAADTAISPRVVPYLFALSNPQNSAAKPEEPIRQNPIAYSHLILPGGIEHVLSRVAESGTDDQDQPDILAHHVVLEGTECTAEGPAWLMALPGFHLSEWNEPPVRFARGRPLPTLTNPSSLTRRQQIARQYRWLDPLKMALTGSVDTRSTVHLAAVQSNDDQIALAVPPASPCPKWTELTNDPGWGGVLAETAFTEQPVVLVYNPEQNILPLYVEALSLLPPRTAWRVTFCTDVMRIPETLPCQWKGVIAGSEEATRLVRDLNNLIIDLTVPMGEALSGRYVDFARSGQEHMLPLDTEEYVAAAVTAETKTYGETPKTETDQWEALSNIPLSKIPHLPLPAIQLVRKQPSLLESFLHRSSRSQFYFLYGIMFALVLFLLVLAADQAWELGIVKMVQDRNRQPHPVPLNVPEPESDPPPQVASALDDTVPEEIPMKPDTALTIFEKNRTEQTVPLLQFLERFHVPDFLAINFPDVQDAHIDGVPEKKTFDELRPLQPYGSALELRFVPLFELSHTQIKTRPMRDELPRLVWLVEAADTETQSAVPMFLFQLTESGLTMDWQPEGLNNQYLYDTILSSLGFLELTVADTPEPVIRISLFAPVITEPVKVSDLSRLAETETPEHVVELPFASELWQQVFAEMKPPHAVRLDVRVEPEGDWAQRTASPESEFHTEVPTLQEAGKPTESGETVVFERIKVPFVAAASLEKVVWKGGEYAEQLRAERTEIESNVKELEQKMGQLQLEAFNGNKAAQEKMDGYRTEQKQCNLRLNEIDNILAKLPDAYKEIGQHEIGQFYYSVFLTADGRALLILTTD